MNPLEFNQPKEEKEMIDDIDSAMQILKRDIAYYLDDVEVRQLFDDVESVYHKLLPKIKGDNYSSRSILSEMRNHIGQNHFTELTDIYESINTVILWYKPGVEIIIEVTPASVLIQGNYKTQVDRIEVPRQLDRTISEVNIAVDKVVKEII